VPSHPATPSKSLEDHLVFSDSPTTPGRRLFFTPKPYANLTTPMSGATVTASIDTPESPLKHKRFPLDFSDERGRMFIQRSKSNPSRSSSTDTSYLYTTHSAIEPSSSPIYSLRMFQQP
jgi:hypothetical protein